MPASGRGIRPGVWGVVALCLAGAGLLLRAADGSPPATLAELEAGASGGVPDGPQLQGRDAGERASPQQPAALLASAAAREVRRSRERAAPGGDRGDGSGDRVGWPGGDRTPDASVALRRTAARAGRGDAVPGGPRQREQGDATRSALPLRPGGAGAPGVAAEGAGGVDGSAVDPALERELAQLAVKLGLEESGPTASRPPEGDPQPSAAADAVATEYLLRERLNELFDGKLLPYNYPIERLRQQIAGEVADLSPVARQLLLEEVAQNFPDDPAPLVMSHPHTGNVYEGPDGEYDPQGVEIHDTETVYLRK